MDVSIIIVNFNTLDLIIECIKSIIKNTHGICYEIIVVDNNTEKNIHQKLSQIFPGQNLKSISLSENLGFGLANNEGFKLSCGRNIFCLNPDTIILNNAIKVLSDLLDSSQKIGACGGNLYDENMCPAVSFRRNLPGLFWELNTLTLGLLDRICYGQNRHFNNTDKCINVGYIVGADLMIKREVISKLGFFSRDYFMYYEETDLCNRILQAGYSIISTPKSKIQHLEGKSFKNNANVNLNKLTVQEESKRNYYKNNHNRIYTKICYFIYQLALYILPTIYRMIGQENRSLELKTRRNLIIK